MSNLLRDEQLGDDLYFDVVIHYGAVEYCPTTVEGTYSGGGVSVNTIEPPALPTPQPKLMAGGSYIVDAGATFFAPGIRINHEDCSQCAEETRKMLGHRQPLIGAPMYLEVTLKSHAQTRKSDRVIKLYVAEENDICIPGNWRALNSFSEGQEGGPAIQLGDVEPGQTVWTPQRFQYVRMSDKPYYLIAQITDVTGTLNPLPTPLYIDPNDLQKTRQWSFLHIDGAK